MFTVIILRKIQGCTKTNSLYVYMKLRNEIHVYFTEKSYNSLLYAAVDFFIVWTVLLLDSVWNRRVNYKLISHIG